MLLNEFGQAPQHKAKRSSKMLESTYGVKIAETSDLHKLFTSAKKAQAIMENLRLQNRSIDDKEYSKYALINETIVSKIDAIYEAKIQKLLEFDGMPNYNINSSKFRNVVDSAVDKAISQYDSGMDLEDVLRHAVYSFRNTPGVVLPSEIFKTEFEKEFSKKLYFSGREPELDQTPVHTPPQKELPPLTGGFEKATILDAVAQMESILEGTLTEGDYDEDHLMAVAEAIVESGDFYNPKKKSPIAKSQVDTASKYLDFLGSNLSIGGEEDDAPVKPEFGKRKELSPADKAKILRIKQQAAKQAQ